MRIRRAHVGPAAALLVCVASATHNAAAEPTSDPHSQHSSAPVVEEAEPPRADGVSGVSVGASLVPGIIVHGSGHYVKGDRGVARTLFWAELTGVGLIVLALVPAVIVGANPYVVPFSALSAMGGVALFGGSWLFDVYGAATPRGARGVPQWRPSRSLSFLGYRYVYDPIFDYRHFLVQGFEQWFGRFRIAPRLDASPSDGNARYRGALSARLLGATPDTRRSAAVDGSFVDLDGGVTHHRFPRDGFDVTTAELAVSSRLDLSKVDRKLSGGFFEFGAGLGISRYSYETSGAGSDDNGLLLMSFALGAYLGDPARRGGEARLYYDHRHDDFAAGLKLEGLGSGPLGHFGSDLRYYLSPHWGAHLDFQVGSAYVTSLSVLYRPERVE